MAKGKKRGGSKAKKGGGTNALTLLKADHDEVKKAFKKFEKMDHEDTEAVQALVTQTCAALTQHAELEESLFYPAVREAIEDEDLMNEALVEHRSAKDLIAQIQSMTPDDPMLHATFSVLGEYVQHHVQEEEGEIFPAARKADIDLKALGEQIMARKGR
jgi:hemerythrin superfamily protein